MLHIPFSCILYSSFYFSLNFFYWAFDVLVGQAEGGYGEEGWMSIWIMLLK